MALQSSDLFIVQRDQQSYKMPASEITSFVPDQPTVGDGRITIEQPGNETQSFTVNQGGNTTITLKNDNDNTTYSAGNGLTLSGTTFSAVAADNTISITGSGISVNVGNLGIPGGTVTEITAGEGIRTGTTSGAPNSGTITTTGSLSVDDTVVRTSGVQEIGGAKTFTSVTTFNAQTIVNGVRQASVATIDNSTSWNMSQSNLWVTNATVISNATNVTPGMSGLIFFNTPPTTWGTYYKFSGGEAPEFAANSVVPYYVKASNEILIGLPTGDIS